MSIKSLPSAQPPRPLGTRRPSDLTAKRMDFMRRSQGVQDPESGSEVGSVQSPRHDLFFTSEGGAGNSNGGWGEGEGAGAG